MLHTAACDALGIRYPVCQAGMATYTSPELVAAVSNAGGFGVNVVLSRLDEAAFAVCLEERVPVLCFSWGGPNDTVQRAREARAAGAKVICQVATVAEVPAALAAGAEAL